MGGVRELGQLAQLVPRSLEASPMLYAMAEAVRFELTEGVNPRRFSRPVP